MKKSLIPVTDIVTSYKKQAVTTSLKIAEVFDKRHSDILRIIDNYIAQSASLRNERKIALVKMFHKTDYLDAKGELRPMYLINKQGFDLVVNGFTGIKALDYKIWVVEEFARMEKQLATIAANLADPQWQLSRLEATDAYKKLAAAVKEYVIPFARLCGSTTEDKWFYKSYAQLVDEVAGVLPHKHSLVPAENLNFLETIANLAVMFIRIEYPECLKGFPENGKIHKDLYRAVKAKLYEFKSISGK